jgi:hypothetical protein
LGGHLSKNSPGSTLLVFGDPMDTSMSNLARRRTTTLRRGKDFWNTL